MAIGREMSRLIKKPLHRILNGLGWMALRGTDGTLELRPRVSLGDDPMRDIRYILGPSIQTVFDVGANEGQTVTRFARAFPEADIYSFEPDPNTFKRLSSAAAGIQRARLFNAAVGREPGEAQLFRFGLDETNSLLPKAAGADSFVVDASYLRETGTVPVSVTTIDAVGEASGISRIDLLKIDTQGYELEVLNGARRFLNSNSVATVFAEVCFVRYYENQPLFQDVYTFLYERGFRLVAIYESGFLTHCYQVGGNALFVHESVGQAKPLRTSFKIGPLKIGW